MIVFSGKQSESYNFVVGRSPHLVSDGLTLSPLPATVLDCPLWGTKEGLRLVGPRLEQATWGALPLDTLLWLLPQAQGFRLLSLAVAAAAGPGET